ncbi:hypothetical protein RHMOL_Rhmol05G0120500 [Rhododendron molle]|uniref:Uncharacterized protein n=1 Tax=Rhododendron molle TaxID=49168 RepID=A0ACC0NQF8_RHOML|nr:hypothetical protein RHMOL_Rhmol05G0120500 [Rhododendron molle]
MNCSRDGKDGRGWCLGYVVAKLVHTHTKSTTATGTAVTMGMALDLFQLRRRKWLR